MSDRWMIVGLGNPGPRYAETRHNIGQMCLDRLVPEVGGGAFRAHRGMAVVLEGRLGGPGGVPVALAKPTSFMNESGGPVSGLLRWFDAGPDRLVVVHDELDIELGAVKIKKGGGEGGHNGLKSITKSLGTPEYTRVRLGIGRPPGRMDPADYVLRPFSAGERTDLDFLLGDGVDAVMTVVTEGVAAAQERFHRRN